MEYTVTLSGVYSIYDLTQPRHAQVMERGCEVLMFSSSATVYGSPQFLPVDETHPTGVAITNTYGRTKFPIEIFIELRVANKVTDMFLGLGPEVMTGVTSVEVYGSTSSGSEQY